MKTDLKIPACIVLGEIRNESDSIVINSKKKRTKITFNIFKESHSPQKQIPIKLIKDMVKKRA
jgi:hypothetical protein